MDVTLTILPAGRGWEEGRSPNPLNPKVKNCGPGILPAAAGLPLLPPAEVNGTSSTAAQ